MWITIMTRVRKDPLRELTAEERKILERISVSSSEPAGLVARARVLLALANGTTIAGAAHAGGRSTRWGVKKLVKRFNERGLSVLEARHGGGPGIRYGPTERERILREFRRKPDLEQDGTNTWSLTTLQRALRKAEDGLPEVSTFVIQQTLHQAGLSWQRSRTWCQTGEVLRKRKEGVVRVVDPQMAKKRGL